MPKLIVFKVKLPSMLDLYTLDLKDFESHAISPVLLPKQFYFQKWIHKHFLIHFQVPIAFFHFIVFLIGIP